MIFCFAFFSSFSFFLFRFSLFSSFSARVLFVFFSSFLSFCLFPLYFLFCLFVFLSFCRFPLFTMIVSLNVDFFHNIYFFFLYCLRSLPFSLFSLSHWSNGYGSCLRNTRSWVRS
ncbi:unnamed protein product [Ectocarpus sp. 12 AP-2014]